MGIVRGSNALSDDLGPKFGRTLAIGAEGDTQVTNMPVTPEAERVQQSGGAGDPSKMDHSKMGHDMSQMDHSKMGHADMQHEMAPGMTMAGSRAPNAAQVPGYPQDMAIIMDDLVAKPETYGLRKTWTIGMMGMMTMVRVLTPDAYDEIERLRVSWQPNETQVRFRQMQGEPPSGHEHHHDE
jgi:hypothetical protein